MDTSLLEKDKLWKKIKRYLYYIIFLLSFLIVLILIVIFLHLKMFKFDMT
jgi:type IV secretory pathway component VirB8